MDKINNLIMQLHKAPNYEAILKGKGEYANFIKRQEALGNVIKDILETSIQNFDEHLFQEIGGKNFVKSKIGEIVNMLNDSCWAFLSGDIANAINLMYDCYFKDGASLRTIQLNHDSIFYRMRKATNYNLFTKDEMSHIPFEKNYLLKNERFSISGFPSLYLGNTVYVCWEEIGRPDFDQANVAVCRNCEECIVIDLCIPSMSEDILGTLLTLPTILFSSLPVLHPDSDFKPEYIIPQLLMQCLVRYNNDPKRRTKAIDGIKYDSIHKYDGKSFYDYREDGLSTIYENYVFPVRKVEDEGLCPILNKLFDVIRVDSFARYELEDYESSKVHSVSTEKKYEKSKFYKMEQHLFKIAKDSMLQYSSLNGAQT